MWVIKRAMSISLFNIADRQALARVSFNPDMYWLILALGLATITLACLESLVNLSEYSLTLILPCFKFMNSLILASLNSRGKKWSRKATLNSSQVTGPTTTLASNHWVYHSWATP